MTTALNPTGLMPALAAAEPALVEPVLHAIFTSAPAPLPDITVDGTPSFAAAEPLAAVVGANPGRLLNAAQHLAADRGEIDAVIGQAIPLIAHAAAGIFATGQKFLASALPLVPGLLAGPAGFTAALELAALAEGALADVDKQLGELRAALEPLVARLHACADGAQQRAPLVPSASAQAAGQELRAMTQPAAFASAGAAEAPDAPTPAPAPVPAPDPASAASGSETGRAAVAAAKSMVGTPYVWGGNSPGGFDCSGLTSWAYQQAGVDLPRTAESQATGRQVSYEDLQPGDLVVWSGHVAMYAGDGMMVEAGDPVQMNPVRTSNIGMPFKGFWRPTA